MNPKLLSRYISANLMFLFVLITALTGCGGGTAAGDGTSSASTVTSSLNSVASSSSSVAAGLKDTTPPTVPAAITKTTVTSGKVELSWSAATDNVAVTAYKVFRNQVLIATLDANTLSYADTTVVPNTTYTYSVKAGDAAGLWSAVKSFSTKTLSFVSTSTSSVSSVSNSTASSASSSIKSTAIAGSAMFKWTIPNQRENGSPLDTTEIGGYEIRYKLKSDSTFTSVTIADGFTNAYTIPNLSGDYEFQIAAYDINQLYSQFVAIYPI